MPHPEITQAAEAIHNPADPRHFMRLKPVNRRVSAWLERRLLAETTAALRVIEIGADAYDPVFYFPLDALCARLEPSSAPRTRCPVKGEAAYLDLYDADGALVAAKIGWRYVQPIPEAQALRDHVAFYATNVRFEDAPL